MEPKGNDMADELVERAITRWSKEPQRDVMLPGLGMKTCGELADALLARLSRPSTAEAVADERAWLIEFSHLGTPHYYGSDDEEGLGQTDDHVRAIRFARAADAQAVIDDIGWTEAKPIEHMWCATPGHPFPQGGAEPAAWRWWSRAGEDWEYLDNYRGDFDAYRAANPGLPEANFVPLYTHPIGETGGTDELVGKQLDRLFIGGGEYVRADAAVRTVTELNRRIAQLEAASSIGPAGEAGDLIERLRYFDETPLFVMSNDLSAWLIENAALREEAAAALTSLRAERDAELARNDVLIEETASQFNRAEAAESSRAAEKLKVAERDQRIGGLQAELRAFHDMTQAQGVKDGNAISALEQRVAALVGSATEIDRLLLVIESAVRSADPGNHEAVLSALKANRAALSLEA